jgi:AraC family ethanolamine operon transcriptional activator
VPVQIKRVPFSDFEALKDVVQDSQSEIVQLGRGPMRGTIHHIDLGDTVSVAAGSFTRAMRASGALSEKRWTLGGLIKSDGPATGHGHELRPGDLFIAAPNTERHFNFQDNSAYFGALITPEEIENHLSAYPGAFEALLKHRLSVLRATSAKAQLNTTSWTMLLETLIHEGEAMSRPIIAHQQHTIMRKLLAPIRDDVHYRGAHLPAPDKLVHKVVEYLHQQNKPISVEELAKIFNIHPRKLHRSFQDSIGMGPFHYHQEKRLSDCHTALRQDGPGVTVKTVANDYGFYDLGRFAKVFKHKFGEGPLKVLKRKITSDIASAIVVIFIMAATTATGIAITAIDLYLTL